MDKRHYYPEKLIAAREGRGLTQVEVAALVSVGVKTVSRVETGVNCSYQLLVRLCQLYSIPMDEIVVPKPKVPRLNGRPRAVPI